MPNLLLGRSVAYLVVNSINLLDKASVGTCSSDSVDNFSDYLGFLIFARRNGGVAFFVKINEGAKSTVALMVVRTFASGTEYVHGTWLEQGVESPLFVWVIICVVVGSHRVADRMGHIVGVWHVLFFV